MSYPGWPREMSVSTCRGYLFRARRPALVFWYRHSLDALVARWTLVRVIRGMLLLNDGKPIPNPKHFHLEGPRVLEPDAGRNVIKVFSASHRSSRHLMLVPLVVVAAIAFLAIHLGLVDAFWRGFCAGLSGRTADL